MVGLVVSPFRDLVFSSHPSGYKTNSVYRRYAIVSESDLREAGAKLAIVTANGDSLGVVR